MIETGGVNYRFHWTKVVVSIKTLRTDTRQLLDLPERLILVADYRLEYNCEPSENGHVIEQIDGTDWVVIPPKREMIRQRVRATSVQEETTHMARYYANVTKRTKGTKGYCSERNERSETKGTKGYCSEWNERNEMKGYPIATPTNICCILRFVAIG
jgi:hypothetical protein